MNFFKDLKAKILKFSEDANSKMDFKVSALLSSLLVIIVIVALFFLAYFFLLRM